MSASGDGLALICIDPKRIAEIWHHVRPMLAKAFIKTAADDSIEDIERDLRSERALLWIVWDASAGRIVVAATTKIMKTAREKLLIITACGGGELHRWSRFIRDFEAYARTEGCTKLRVSGRAGWKRIMSDYTEPFVTLEKALN